MLVPDGLILQKGDRRAPAWAVPFMEDPEADVRDVVFALQRMKDQRWKWRGWRPVAEPKQPKPRAPRPPRPAPPQAPVTVDMAKVEATLQRLGRRPR